MKKLLVCVSLLLLTPISGLCNEAEDQKLIAKCLPSQQRRVRAAYEYMNTAGWFNFRASRHFDVMLEESFLFPILRREAIRAAKLDSDCQELRKLTGIKAESQYLKWGLASLNARRLAIRSAEFALESGAENLPRPWEDALVAVGAKEWLRAGAPKPKLSAKEKRELEQRLEAERKKAEVERRRAEAREKARQEEREKQRRAAEEARRKAELAKIEKRASADLRYAKKLILRGDLRKAKQRLEEVIKEYPKTKSAEEAKKLIGELN